MRALAALVAVVSCTGCSKSADPDSPDNWFPLFKDYPPKRLVNLWLPVPDATCLASGLTQVLGVIDGESMRQLATQAHERYPLDAIIGISANGPYAEVQTGRDCRPDTESGEGYFLRFRYERGQWQFKGEDRWVG